MAYHLHKDFENWYSQQNQKIGFDSLKDISISTDGILTFSPIKKTDNDEKINAAEYLMTDPPLADTEEMLNKKLKKLEHHYGLKPTDDLAMIRLIR